MAVNQELISVVIPVYNAEKFLSRCLQSLCNQSYEYIEILAVDDGSTDGSLNILKEFTEKDKRIKIYRKENGGLTSAVTIGVKNATGAYMTFVDSDDYVDCDFIENFYKNIGDADVLAMGIYYQDRDKNIEFKLSKNKLYNKSEIIRLSKNYVCSSSWGMSSKIFVARWNKMYKTQVVKKIIDLYSELNLTHFEDSYFNFLILNNINSIKTLSAANGYHYCIDSSSMTRGYKDLYSFNEAIKKICIASRKCEVSLSTKCFIHYDLTILFAWEYVTYFVNALPKQEAINSIAAILNCECVKLSLKRMNFFKLSLNGKVKLILFRMKASGLLYKLIKK